MKTKQALKQVARYSLQNQAPQPPSDMHTAATPINNDGNAAPSPPSDQMLLNALLAGDNAIMWQIWSRHKDRLSGICRHTLRRDDMAVDDALAEVLLKVLRLLPAHAASIERLDAWLNRLAQNHCRDILRRINAETNKLETLDVCHSARSDNSPMLTAADTPETMAINNESAMYIQGVFDALPARLADIVQLRLYQELPYDQIAQRLGLSSSAARKRMQEARKILQTKLRSAGLHP